MIDLSHASTFLVALASSLVTVCTPILVTAILRYLKVAQNSAFGDDIENAVNAGARVALDALKSVAAHNLTLEVKNKALQAGVSKALALAEAAMIGTGTTADEISQYVSAEVAKVLGVGAAAPVVPAPAPVPVVPAVPPAGGGVSIQAPLSALVVQ